MSKMLSDLAQRGQLARLSRARAEDAGARQGCDGRRIVRKHVEQDLAIAAGPSERDLPQEAVWLSGARVPPPDRPPVAAVTPELRDHAQQETTNALELSWSR